jgi:leucyl-tRNA synthetase
MGEYGAAAPWSDASVRGCKRFLERFAGLTDIVSDEADSDKIVTGIHKCIKKVSEDIETMKFNTAIAAMMGLLNDIISEGHITRDNLVILVKLLSPFAPHLAEEMYKELGGEGYVSLAEWPEYDPNKVVDANIEIAVQVNGKLKATIVIPNGCEKEEALRLAHENDAVCKAIDGKNLIKEIYVPGKIVNLVAK